MIGQRNNSVSKVNSSEIEDQKTAYNSAAWSKQDKIWKENWLSHTQNIEKKIVFWLVVPQFIVDNSSYRGASIHSKLRLIKVYYIYI